jgi:TetR/AcrR family transcriptional regulator, transcriptional repressor for nem operon
MQMLPVLQSVSYMQAKAGTEQRQRIVAMIRLRMAVPLEPPRQRDEKALAMVASLVGALVLARAVNDPELSDDILRVTRNRLEG